MRTKIKRIRSGGQTGVDRAALDMARKHHIVICGWCPRGGLAEDLPSPPGLLSDYPELQETPSAGTAQRTRWNMRDTDAILTIMPESSAASKGTEIGLQEGILLQKPMFTARGLSTVETLSDKGATVIILCRNEERGGAALAKITGQKERDLELLICDLGDYASIRNFVRDVKEKYLRVDIPVNNAGFISLDRQETKE